VVGGTERVEAADATRSDDSRPQEALDESSSAAAGVVDFV